MNTETTETTPATFADLKFGPYPHPHPLFVGAPAIRATYTFPNGYSVSVVRGPRTYGGSQGLYEAAIMLGNTPCYTTHITDDVVGNLSEEGVTQVMADIAALPGERA